MSRSPVICIGPGRVRNKVVACAITYYYLINMNAVSSGVARTSGRGGGCLGHDQLPKYLDEQKKGRHHIFAFRMCRQAKKSCR